MTKTTDDLAATLANALGLPHKLVEATARYLREAEMLAEVDAPATAEHATILLLALMAAPNPEDAPDSARLYTQLPLDRITRGELTSDGRTELIDISDPSPLMGEFRDLGETFGVFLASLIEFSEPDFFVEPGDIVVGGGTGRTRHYHDPAQLRDSAEGSGAMSRLKVLDTANGP